MKARPARQMAASRSPISGGFARRSPGFASAKKILARLSSTAQTGAEEESIHHVRGERGRARGSRADA